ncbi:hypothetical protein [Amylibacter sp. IMCC11727]|uniref:hypothetical protein n=1 Tax=Amylibacter sp. IMCC11727 TaxID=3039851 RepID=UPI00244DBD82|nr:hypothetical protein [Amylibacter sp. IMCC11727]WGI22402.1 hypothetical protein QBD29_03010 [Amylibacter sp. IMCC11727]
MKIQIPQSPLVEWAPIEHTNILRIAKWFDLPPKTETASYFVKNGTTEFEILLAERTRQTLEALMKGPIYAASICRLSHQIALLRRLGVDIITKNYCDDPQTGAKRYGVYFLVSRVQQKSKGQTLTRKVASDRTSA